MADKEVIKEFLVSLGFKLDKPSIGNFENSLKSITKFAKFTGNALLSVAVSAEEMVGKFASGMEKMYYASRRTRTSVENLQAFKFGVEQLGISSESAMSALESFSKVVRTQPGALAILEGMGINTKGKENLQLLQEFVAKLAKLPHYIGAQFAETLGIPEEMFFMLKNGGLEKLNAAEKERLNLQSQAGFSSQAAAEASKEYMNALRGITERVTILGQQFAVSLLPLFQEFSGILIGVLDDLIKFSGMPLGDRIAYWAEQLRLFVVNLKDAIAELKDVSLGEIFGFLKDRAVASKNQIKAMFGGTAVPAENETLPPLPINRPVAKNVTPITSAKSNSEKLFGQLESTYGLPTGTLDRMWATESGRGKNMLSPVGAMGHFQFMPKTAKEFGLTDPNDLTQSATAAARYISQLMSKYGGSIQSALAAYNWGPGNLDKYGLGAAPSETRNYINKIAPGGSSAVNQQTTINVMGTTDPATTAKYVGEEQKRVNGDLVRNFGGAVR